MVVYLRLLGVAGHGRKLRVGPKVVRESDDAVKADRVQKVSRALETIGERERRRNAAHMFELSMKDQQEDGSSESASAVVRCCCCPLELGKRVRACMSCGKSCCSFFKSERMRSDVLAKRFCLGGEART